MLDNKIINKHFTDVPSSSVPPEGEQKPVYRFNDICGDVEKLVSQLGVDVHSSYKTGSVSSRNIKLDTASRILDLIHTAYFDQIKLKVSESNLSPEDLARANTQIKHIQDAFESLVEISDDVQKKLDINSVLFILYGILNELIKKRLK